MSDKFETYINEFKEQNTELRTEFRTEGALRVEEIQFNNGETNILIIAKLISDINKKYRRYKNKFEKFRTRN